MNVVVCDDELTIASYVKNEIKNHLSPKDKIYAYTDYSKIIKEVRHVDILFIDISLKDKSGIEYVKDNTNYYKDTIIIYMTGYDEYIEDAFETDPIYILRKPLTVEKINRALAKAIERLNSLDDAFIFKTSKEFIKIKYSDLYYIESKGRIIYFYTKKDTLKKYGRLKEIDDMLDNRFMRIHKSYIINIDKIKVYKSSKVILEDGTELSISRTYAKECKEKLLSYL